MHLSLKISVAVLINEGTECEDRKITYYLHDHLKSTALGIAPTFQPQAFMGYGRCGGFAESCLYYYIRLV